MGSKQHAFVYVETDLPDGVTLSDWRRAKAHVNARSGRLTPAPASLGVGTTNVSTMPTTTPKTTAPAPTTRPAEHPASGHRYVRPTVQEIRRHGEASVPQQRAA